MCDAIGLSNRLFYRSERRRSEGWAWEAAEQSSAKLACSSHSVRILVMIDVVPAREPVTYLRLTRCLRTSYFLYIRHTLCMSFVRSVAPATATVPPIAVPYGLRTYARGISLTLRAYCLRPTHSCGPVMQTGPKSYSFSCVDILLK